MLHAHSSVPLPPRCLIAGRYTGVFGQFGQIGQCHSFHVVVMGWTREGRMEMDDGWRQLDEGRGGVVRCGLALV
jgi:hypothetical protein